MECVILIGLPASGKSTFFRERFAGTHDHVSKDLLRNNRTRRRRQEQLISASLASGRSVVIDNTNPSVAVRAPLIAAARTRGAEVVGYFFVTDAADALRRAPPARRIISSGSGPEAMKHAMPTLAVTRAFGYARPSSATSSTRRWPIFCA